MTEPKEKKKKSPVSVEAQRPVSGTVGEILRAARMQKKLGYEEISAAIHVRPSQLRAIEEGNIAALPGMTYALGFVKSYAVYLKLNAPEIVQKFKTEHAGVQNAAQPLHYPEPLADGPHPNWFVIGIAGGCAVLLLAAWAIFSGGSDKAALVAEKIPPAPAVGTMTGITHTPQPPAPTTLAGSNLLTTPPPPAAAPVVPVAATPVPAIAAAQPASVPVPAVLKPQPAPQPVQQQQPVIVQPVKPQAAPQQEVINIKRGEGRVVLMSNQPTWIEVRNQAVHAPLYQKVLRPGDQYYVPDQKGIILNTGNAGGIDVYVDGVKVKPLGQPGQILRNVKLDPDALKVRDR